MTERERSSDACSASRKAPSAAEGREAASRLRAERGDRRSSRDRGERRSSRERERRRTSREREERRRGSDQRERKRRRDSEEAGRDGEGRRREREGVSEDRESKIESLTSHTGRLQRSGRSSREDASCRDGRHPTQPASGRKTEGLSSGEALAAVERLHAEKKREHERRREKQREEEQRRAETEKEALAAVVSRRREEHEHQLALQRAGEILALAAHADALPINGTLPLALQNASPFVPPPFPHVSRDSALPREHADRWREDDERGRWREDDERGRWREDGERGRWREDDERGRRREDDGRWSLRNGGCQVKREEERRGVREENVVDKNCAVSKERGDGLRCESHAREGESASAPAPGRGGTGARPDAERTGLDRRRERGGERETRLEVSRGSAERDGGRERFACRERQAEPGEKDRFSDRREERETFRGRGREREGRLAGAFPGMLPFGPNFDKEEWTRLLDWQSWRRDARKKRDFDPDSLWTDQRELSPTRWKTNPSSSSASSAASASSTREKKAGGEQGKYSEEERTRERDAKRHACMTEEEKKTEAAWRKKIQALEKAGRREPSSDADATARKKTRKTKQERESSSESEEDVKVPAARVPGMDGSALEKCVAEKDKAREEKMQKWQAKEEKRRRKLMKETKELEDLELEEAWKKLGPKDFVKSASFKGPRPGFVFHTGEAGTGYYKDRLSIKKLVADGVIAVSGAQLVLAMKKETRTSSADEKKKSKKKSKKSKKTSKKKGKKKRKKQDSSDSDSDSDSSDSSDSESSRAKKRGKSRQRKRVSSSESSSEDSEESEVEREDSPDRNAPKALRPNVAVLEAALAEKKAADALANAACGDFSDEDEDDAFGPNPLGVNSKLAARNVDYGGALRPGEGAAIAQYVQEGKRIPRRGEVGLTADEIQAFEDLGYVMSGSRHRRMNAIRIRKENQVYSAEEQRALAMFNYEEKANREAQLINDLRDMLKRQNETLAVEEMEEKLGKKE